MKGYTVVFQGVCSGVISPTSLDLSQVFNISLEDFVRAASARYLGILSGSLTGGILADKLRPKADLGLSLTQMVRGLACLAIPWAPGVPCLAALFFIIGLCQGTLNVGEYTCTGTPVFT